MSHPAAETPLLTAEHPGVGGRIKAELDDFVVEEIPAYEPSGSGDHLYLWVEKRGVGPEFFARTIAQRLSIPAGEVGTAGLKDRYAVSRQWVSVPARAEPNLKKIDGEGIAVLNATRHNNKLKPGHLRGNRFQLLVRGADTTRTESVAAILTRIRQEGLPNYYGPQRFGRDGSTADLGFRCLAGMASKRLRPFLFKFAISAAQSVLFNDTLARRQLDGLLRTVLPGDVMMKWPGGGMFVAEDVANEQARFDARETVIGGPMFGSRTYPAQGVAAEREARVLADHDITPATFARFGKLASGTRRHSLIYIEDLTHQWEPAGLRLTFTLPSGSYATVLLREIMKAPLESGEEPDSDDSSD